jgi:hypothetical protein
MAIMGANSFAYCLNRKMLDMPESSGLSNQREGEHLRRGRLGSRHVSAAFP